MAVIVGTAGAGKTRAIKEYAKLRPNAVLIEATIRTRGKELFTMIADELGVKYQTSQDATVRACADELKRSDKFFIIDEAEHLPYAALELLRRLHDFSSSALILVGTDALVDNLRGSANTRKGREFRQLSSRIVGKYEYRGLTQRKEIDGRVTEDLKDLREVCARYGIEDLKSVEMIKRLARANWRKSENLIERAKRLGAYYENRIDKEIIKEASSMIFLD